MNYESSPYGNYFNLCDDFLLPTFIKHGVLQLIRATKPEAHIWPPLFLPNTHTHTPTTCALSVLTCSSYSVCFARCPICINHEDKSTRR